MKGVIKPDHMPTNKYELVIVGLPPLTPVTMTGMEDEIETHDMPDKTVVSSGNRKASEFEIAIPMHHSVEMAAMEVWFQEGQDPVSPAYKKAGTAIYKSISENVLRVYALVGAYPSKRKLPDAEMAAEGDMANVTWTIKVDDHKPIS
jgi:hypothetical protein